MLPFLLLSPLSPPGKGDPEELHISLSHTQSHLSGLSYHIHAGTYLVLPRNRAEGLGGKGRDRRAPGQAELDPLSEKAPRR
jgi:hypothetical protein